jgi:hypothetical protein
MQRWLNGEAASLWQDIPFYKKPAVRKNVTPDLEKALRQHRCDASCREGADAKACKALFADGPVNPDAALREMRSKHLPAAHNPDMDTLGAPNRGPVPMIEAAAITAALKTFGRHSAGGLTDLRPIHLKQALLPAYADQVTEHLMDIVNLLVQGNAHADVMP